MSFSVEMFSEEMKELLRIYGGDTLFPNAGGVASAFAAGETFIINAGGDAGASSIFAADGHVSQIPTEEADPLRKRGRAIGQMTWCDDSDQVETKDKEMGSGGDQASRDPTEQTVSKEGLDCTRKQVLKPGDSDHAGKDVQVMEEGENGGDSRALTNGTASAEDHGPADGEEARADNFVRVEGQEGGEEKTGLANYAKLQYYLDAAAHAEAVQMETDLETAKELQKQFDLEVRYRLNALRFKGSDDEYPLRRRISDAEVLQLQNDMELAKKLQQQFDFELRYRLNALRFKGSKDEYPLRKKFRPN